MVQLPIKAISAFKYIAFGSSKGHIRRIVIKLYKKIVTEVLTVVKLH